MNKRSNTIRTAAVAAGALMLALSLTGCIADSATTKDQQATNDQAQRYGANQPVPASDWSQYRQTIIDVELAQIHGVVTTSFFMNQGVEKPYMVCPSIGFPVATTSQLTNPDQVAFGGRDGSGANGDYGVIAQMEPNGVYTGDSSGTYVVCVASDGTRYIQYAEAFVHTVGAPAHWDNEQGLIVLDGAPTVISTEQPE